MDIGEWKRKQKGQKLYEIQSGNIAINKCTSIFFITGYVRIFLYELCFISRGFSRPIAIICGKHEIDGITLLRGIYSFVCETWSTRRGVTIICIFCIEFSILRAMDTLHVNDKVHMR